MEAAEFIAIPQGPTIEAPVNDKEETSAEEVTILRMEEAV
jgi:hypothetical protein